MMDFIMIPLIIGIITAGIYGLFELFVRKKERLAIIEKIGDKLDASAFDLKIGVSRILSGYSTGFSSLKAGCLLFGIGLGLLVGFLLAMSATGGDPGGNRNMTSTIYGASVLLFGGISLIISFFIEVKMSKKMKDDENNTRV